MRAMEHKLPACILQRSNVSEGSSLCVHGVPTGKGWSLPLRSIGAGNRLEAYATLLAVLTSR